MITMLAAAALALQTFNPDISQLGWLSGHWRTEATELSWTEELWSGTEGQSLLGLNRTVQDDRTDGFEFMRIAADEQGPAFHVSPSGASVVRFAMVESRPNIVVFENRAHDYPQRIVYRREGDRLLATVSLADGSRPMSWTFRRQP